MGFYCRLTCHLPEFVFKIRIGEDGICLDLLKKGRIFQKYCCLLSGLIHLDNSDFLILAVSQSTSRSMWGKLPVTEFYACLSISSELQLSSETYVHSVQDICNCRIPLNP